MVQAGVHGPILPYQRRTDWQESDAAVRDAVAPLRGRRRIDFVTLAGPLAYRAPMAFTVQVTIDCADPHALADWWAETLGWQVEASDEAFIRRMVAEGHATEDETVVHRGTLSWRSGAAIRHPDGLEPRILFQQVPEGKVVKNRVHLDIRHGDADVEAVRAGLVARGATILHAGRQGPHTWVTMTDPEGNEFCV